MIAKINGGSFDGLFPIRVTVEVSAQKGIPTFDIVGMGQTEVKEGKKRIQSALMHTGVRLKNKKVTVNLAPAGIRKSGAYLDLPIAVAVLKLMGILPRDQALKWLCFGELSLDGGIRPVQGAYALIEALARKGTKTIIPYENRSIIDYFPGYEIYAVKDMGQLIQVLKMPESYVSPEVPEVESIEESGIDFSQVKGQAQAKRMLQIAAAGRHHAVLSGPPGVGKSLLAKAYTSILPDLSPLDLQKVRKIYSAAGFDKLPARPPIRMPHHHATLAGMVGGGVKFHVGDFTLAHGGVLFMDEFPEFRRDIIEALREPMEEGMVRIRRASGLYEYPAGFQLLAAMNLCPCGNLGDVSAECQCSHASLDRYRKKLSKPIVDRIDLSVVLPKVPWDKVWKSMPQKSSKDFRLEIISARKMQNKRWKDQKTNAHASLDALKSKACIHDEALSVVQKMVDQHKFSVRSMVKTLRVSRTIADLTGEEKVMANHVMEAMQFRWKER